MGRFFKSRAKPGALRRLVGWLPLLLVVGLWVHSQFYGMEFAATADEGYFLTSHRGEIVFRRFQWGLYGPDPFDSLLHFYHQLRPVDQVVLFPGPKWYDNRTHIAGQSYGDVGLHLPIYWFMLLAVGWLVMLAIFRRRQAMTHACPKCRYDLRGNPSAASCPECGAALRESSSADTVVQAQDR